MLHLIKSQDDVYFKLLEEDPVRPHIPHTSRVGYNKDIFVYRDEHGQAKAITCVSYQHSIPQTESELFEKTEEVNVAVFYTIWSYTPGAGKQLIFDAVNYIKTQNANIKRFVTLSPKTVMAEKFHIKNGAITFRENQDTVNYEYLDKI